MTTKEGVEKLRANTKDWEVKCRAFIDSLEQRLPDSESRRKIVRALDLEIRYLMAQICSDHYREQITELGLYCAETQQLMDEHVEFLRNIRKELAPQGGQEEN